MNYGMINNASPAEFANEFHGFFHDAYKLKQTIDTRTVCAVLQCQVQENSQMDLLIRQCVMSDTENERPMLEIIRVLQGFAIAHACPAGVSRPFRSAATSTISPTSITLSPSQLYFQEKYIQRGLRSATPQPHPTTPDGNGRKGDTPAFTHQHGICHAFLRTGQCQFNEACKTIHVVNPGALQGPGGPVADQWRISHA